MIDVKEAVKVAFKEIGNLYTTDELTDLTLEEVELSEDEQYWLITLGFTQTLSLPIEAQRQTSFFDANPLVQEISTMRVYKTLKIDANTGEFQSMKIRTI
ncbi:MAG: hypothetical protein R3264_11035 [Anaerolineae bacterium]|nr:hypothetical protein [Anaerolineae bacterium]